MKFMMEVHHMLGCQGDQNWIQLFLLEKFSFSLVRIQNNFGPEDSARSRIFKTSIKVQITHICYYEIFKSDYCIFSVLIGSNNCSYQLIFRFTLYGNTLRHVGSWRVLLKIFKLSGFKIYWATVPSVLRVHNLISNARSRSNCNYYMER